MQPGARGYAATARGAMSGVMPRAISDSVYQRTVPGLGDAVPLGTEAPESMFREESTARDHSGATEAYYDAGASPFGRPTEPQHIRVREAHRRSLASRGARAHGASLRPVRPAHEAALQAAYEDGAEAATTAAAAAAVAAEREERLGASRRTLKQRVADVERAVETGNAATAQLHRAELERLTSTQDDVRTTQYLLAATFGVAVLALIASITGTVMYYTVPRSSAQRRV